MNSHIPESGYWSTCENGQKNGACGVGDDDAKRNPASFPH